MSLSRKLWPWTLALVAIAGGCATIDAGVELTTERPERPDRQAANEAASLADSELNDEAASASSDSPVTVHVSDEPANGAAAGAEAITPKSAPAEYRSAKETVAAGQQSRAPQSTAAAQAESPTVDDEAAFNSLMTEARRRGELSAADETAFRRDLSAMPAHLRPQMAAMLLAMRKRSAEPSAPAAANTAASPPRPAISQLQSAALLGGDAQQTVFSAPASTTDRLTRIASGSAAHPALDENPLRALATAAGRNGAGSTSSALLNAQIAAAAEQQARHSPSNAPAEVVAPGAREDLSTQWPDAAAIAAKTDRPAASRSANASPSEEWQVMLGATIRSLEADLAKRPEDPENARREALLRMLYLVANRLDDAARPVPADAREQQFWVDWLYGTSVYLDSAATPNDGQRSAIAADRLREAVQRLGEQSNLVVQNLAFCRKVTSFGVYESFDAKPTAKLGEVKSIGTVQEFAPNQEVLLYAEIRNFTSQSSAKGYHTALRPSYQIFDSAGRRLGSVVELDDSHDYCQRPRTDFFVCYHIYLPTRIDPGSYTLKLTIEDVHGHKAGEDDIDFVIKAR